MKNNLNENLDMERNIRTYGPSSANAAETNRGTFDWQKHEVALDEMFFKNSALFSRCSIFFFLNCYCKTVKFRNSRPCPPFH